MSRIAAIVLVTCVAAAACPGVALAQTWTPLAGPDHNLVILRAVKPRVAYRGLEPERYAVKSKVQLVPDAALGQASRGLSVLQATDDMLAGTASPIVGTAALVQGAMPMLGSQGVATGPMANIGATVVGASAQAGGVVRGVTSGLGSLITGVVGAGTGGRGP